MKTIIKGLLTTGAAFMLATGAYAGDMKTVMASIRANQQHVNADLIKVNSQQQRVKTAGQACKTEKSAAAHKEYKDAKADLKEYRAQLLKDKQDLMAAHKEHIKLHEAEAEAERKDLQALQFKLDREKVMGKQESLATSDKLMDSREDFRSALNDLERARLERDKDMWVVNREYFDTNAKTNMQLASFGNYSDNTAQK